MSALQLCYNGMLINGWHRPQKRFSFGSSNGNLVQMKASEYLGRTSPNFLGKIFYALSSSFCASELRENRKALESLRPSNYPG